MSASLSTNKSCYNIQYIVPITSNRFKIDENGYRQSNSIVSGNKQCGDTCELIVKAENYVISRTYLKILQYLANKSIRSEIRNWYTDPSNPYLNNTKYFASTTDGTYIYLPNTGYQILFLQEAARILGGTNNDVYRYIANNYFTFQSGYKYKIGTDENAGDSVASGAYNVLVCLFPFLLPNIYQVRRKRFTEFPRNDFLFGVYNSLYNGSFTNIGTQYSPFNTLRFYTDDGIPSVEYSGRVCMVSTGNLAPIYFCFKIPNGKWLTITIQVNILPMIPVVVDENYSLSISQTTYGFKPIYFNKSTNKYETAYHADYTYKYPSVSFIDGDGGYGAMDEVPVNTYMSNLVCALNFFAPLYYLDFDDQTRKLKIPKMYIKRKNYTPTQFEFDGNIPDKTGWDVMHGIGSFSSNNTLPGIYLSKLNSIPKVDNSDKYRFATFIDDYRVSEQKTTVINLPTMTTGKNMEIEIQYRNVYYEKNGIQYPQQIPTEEDCSVPFITYITIRNWNENLKNSNNVVNFPFANMILATNETNVPLIL